MVVADLAVEPDRSSWAFDEGAPIGPGRTVLKPLGGGSRYEALLVWDERLFAIMVAKVLRPDLGEDEHALRELRREAEALDRLAHPVIVRGFDAVLDGPHPHLLIEHLEGPTLRRVIKKGGPLPRQQAHLLLRPWLYRIAHNTAHNALRDNARRDEPLGEEGAIGDLPETVVERREELRSVLASVQDLPPRQRDALVLRELEGRSYEEISAVLGVGGGAVRQLLNRARTKLRTAATAITPVGLLLRLPPTGSGAGESVAARVAEMTGAAGAGAVVTKVAATALVTGAVAGGAAVAPLGESDGTPAPRDRAAEAREERGGATTAPATTAPSSVEPASSEVPARAVSRTRADSSGPGSGDGSGHDRRGDSSGPGDGSGSSSSSGPGGGSGSGDGTSGSNSGPGSGSSDSGSSGSGSGSGSGFGSDTSGSGSGD